MTSDTVHEEPDGVDEVDEISGRRTEQVRIVGAERAADALTQPPDAAPSPPDAGDTAGPALGGSEEEADQGVADDEWGPEDWPTPSEPQLLHWTEAPTGEVPAVLSRGRASEGRDPWALPEPTWREEHHDWQQEEAPFFGAGGEDSPLLSEAAEEERQPWSFDLDAPETPGQAGTATSRPGSGGYEELETDDLFEAWHAAERDTGEPPEEGAEGVQGGVAVGRGDEFGDEPADVGEKTTMLQVPPVADRAGRPGGAGTDDDTEERSESRRQRSEGQGSSRPRLGRRRGEDADAAAVAADAAAQAAAPASEAPGRPATRMATPRPARPPGGRPPARLVPSVAGAGDDALSQRAGRNIPAAVASGIVIGGLALLAFHFGTVPSMVVVTVVLTAAAIEAYAAFRRAYRPATLLGIVAVAGLLVGTYDKPFVALPAVLVLLVAATFLWHLIGVDAHADPVRSTAATLLVFGWVGVFGSYAALLLAPSVFPHRTGIAYLLGALIAAVAYDVGALAVGAWLGRHPLSAASPGKTWEGVLGGAVAAIVFSVGVVHLVHPWTLAEAAVLGVVVAVVSPIGDLCESLVKRHLGRKDMGRILPGHGGLLDRIDGLLFVLPATYYLVRAFGHG